MNLMIFAAGVGLFGLFTRFWSPAMSLAVIIILGIALRGFAQ